MKLEDLKPGVVYITTREVENSFGSKVLKHESNPWRKFRIPKGLFLRVETWREIVMDPRNATMWPEGKRDEVLAAKTVNEPGVVRFSTVHLNHALWVTRQVRESEKDQKKRAQLIENLVAALRPVEGSAELFDLWRDEEHVVGMTGAVRYGIKTGRLKLEDIKQLYEEWSREVDP